MGTVNTDTKGVRERSSYNQTITVVIDTVRFISMDGYVIQTTSARWVQSIAALNNLILNSLVLEISQ